MDRRVSDLLGGAARRPGGPSQRGEAELTDENDEAVRLERLLPAPIEDVFAAWTEPSRMARWLAPVGRAEVQAGVVVGGRLRVVMIDGEVRIEHDGEYLEIQPPHRLSFTWRSRYTGEEPSVVTVELSDEGGSTRLVLHHDRLPPEARTSHQGGWGAILDRLAALITTGEAREDGVSTR